jgi:hypothetical protein
LTILKEYKIAVNRELVGQTGAREANMKKKTTDTARKPKSGPQATKFQLSVRIDRTLMEEAQAYIERTGDHITDMLETGLQMFLKEKAGTALVPLQLRFIVQNMSLEAQRRCINHLVREIFPHYRQLTPFETRQRQRIIEDDEAMPEWPDYAGARSLLANPGAPLWIE